MTSEVYTNKTAISVTKRLNHSRTFKNWQHNNRHTPPKLGNFCRRSIENRDLANARSGTARNTITESEKSGQSRTLWKFIPNFLLFIFCSLSSSVMSYNNIYHPLFYKNTITDNFVIFLKRLLYWFTPSTSLRIILLNC